MMMMLFFMKIYVDLQAAHPGLLPLPTAQQDLSPTDLIFLFPMVNPNLGRYRDTWIVPHNQFEDTPVAQLVITPAHYLWVSQRPGRVGETLDQWARRLWPDSGNGPFVLGVHFDSPPGRTPWPWRTAGGSLLHQHNDSAPAAKGGD